MENDLLSDVVERLDRADVDEGVDTLVLAACTDALEEVVEGVDVARPARSDKPSVEPPGVFLTSIAVEGFRGIGERRSLDLHPGPGLTLVVGRNGSGKSSFAEALEVLFTGTSRRWEDRPRTWLEGWRNVHTSGGTALRAKTFVEGQQGVTILRRDWLADADLDDVQTTVRRADLDDTSLPEMGWDGPVETYRPFLSYDELGSLLTQGPSRAFDAMNAVLGIEELTAAQERLRKLRLDIDRTVKDVESRRKQLVAALEGMSDERAIRANAALASRSADYDTLDELLVEDELSAEEGGQLDTLRGLTGLELPTVEQVADANQRLRQAMADVEAMAGTDAAESEAIAATLEDALNLHADHGDRPCPVCGEGALDNSWRTTAEAQLSDLRRRAQAASTAVKAMEAAVRHAHGLCARPPAVLSRAPDVGIDAAAATVAWEQWAEAPEDPAALSTHLSDVSAPVREHVNGVCQAARDELARRNAEWAPLARQVATWTEEARNVEVLRRRVTELKAAEQWLKGAVADIRAERFRPVAERARRLWGLMRQQSNVQLEDVVLAGSATHRRLDLEVTVDGTASGALGVMSQGELHALALSLFLPRATLPESPFRFVVIDDPVQSMDPARVEGLARVLEEIARRRQVVVFTHDDRLPEAVRRLDIDARVVGVTRRPGSRVEVREELGPVERHLEDARALARSTEVDPRLRGTVVPGLCRAALEAGCAEVALRRRLQAGAVHADVIQLLESATTVNMMMALALFDDASAGGQVLSRLNAWGRPLADAYQWCRKGAHGKADDGDDVRRVEDVARLTAKVRAL